MPNPNVYEVARIEDIDGLEIAVGVDYGTVVIAGHRLNAAGIEKLHQVVSRATYWAGQDDQREEDS